MVSARLAWDRSPNPFSIAVEARRATGRPMYDLTVSNPVAVGFGPSHERLRSALDHPDLARYRPDPRGDRRARRAVADTYRPVPVDPDHVVLAASTSEAYGFLFKLLCDPGDEVLVPIPSYPLFEYLAALEGVRVRAYPLRYDGAWHVDLEALRGAVDGRVRAIVAVHPNNPTGSYLRREEIETLCTCAAAAGAAVISDEVFREYPLDVGGIPEDSLAAQDRVPVFVLGGLSKAVACPQLKLGWIVVAGPERERARTLARLDLVADTYLSASAPAQLAAAALLPDAGAIRAPIQDRIRGSLARLRAGLAGSPAHVLRVDGGWSAIVRLPSTGSGEERSIRWIREHGVVVQPGYLFDLEGDTHVVVSLLTAPDVLDAAIPVLASP